MSQHTLVKDLVETRHEGDILHGHSLSFGVDPHWLGGWLDTTNVSVGSEEDVLQLSLLLVDPLHTQPLLSSALA